MRFSNKITLFASLVRDGFKQYATEDQWTWFYRASTGEFARMPEHGATVTIARLGWWNERNVRPPLGFARTGDQPRGHCSDGSGIQKHSVGEIYPWMIRGIGNGARVDYQAWNCQTGAFGPRYPSAELALVWVHLGLGLQQLVDDQQIDALCDHHDAMNTNLAEA